MAPTGVFGMHPGGVTQVSGGEACRIMNGWRGKKRGWLIAYGRKSGICAMAWRGVVSTREMLCCVGEREAIAVTGYAVQLGWGLFNSSAAAAVP